VLTDLLRRDLGFGGLVVTDALVMEAIAGRHGAGEAAVLALEAGADLVLMPEDADVAIDAILTALATGRLRADQLEASAERRRAALARVGRGDAGDGGGAERPLGILGNGPLPEDRALALELVQRSLRRRGVDKVAVAGNGLNLIRVDGALGCPFLTAAAPALAWPTAAGLRTVLIDGSGPSPWRASDEGPLDLERLGDGPVLLQLFVRGNPFRGTASGQEPWPAVIQQLQGAGRLAGLAVYGSPYLWETLAGLLQEGIPAAWSPGQMPLAQAHLLASLGLDPAAARSPQGSANSGTDAANAPRAAAAVGACHDAPADVDSGNGALPANAHSGFTD
jgi:beta-glucosidase